MSVEVWESEKIKEVIEQLSLKQVDIAKEVGVKPIWLNKVLNQPEKYDGRYVRIMCTQILKKRLPDAEA